MSIITDSVFLTKIKGELIETIAKAPVLESKKLYIFQTLEDIFKNIDLTITFTKKSIIIYHEVLPAEILIHMHSWLRTKACCIENITLIVCGHTGIRRWWSEWCQVHGEKSFQIVEGKPSDADFSKIYKFDKMPNADFFLSQKNIQLFFSFYGGSYALDERCYLILRILELHKHGFVDFLGEFFPKQQILNYAEYITYYVNQQEVESLSKLYDQFVVDSKLQNTLSFSTSKQVLNEAMYGDFQWNVDRRCFASVIRETLVDEQYACFSEKTLRTFLHHLVAIPTCYRAVDDLEALGFWFPHDIIDYSYQNKNIYSERISSMIQSIKNVNQQMSVEDLNQYYYQNITKFNANAQLAYDLLTKPTL